MTSKPDAAPTGLPQAAPLPGQHPHILPTTGGSYLLVDGALLPAPPALNPDPEV